MKNQTKHIDECECVYCGHFFNGGVAINYDLNQNIVICPKCEKEMEVYMSVEYLCLPIQELR